MLAECEELGMRKGQKGPGVPSGRRNGPWSSGWALAIPISGRWVGGWVVPVYHPPPPTQPYTTPGTPPSTALLVPGTNTVYWVPGSMHI